MTSIQIFALALLVFAFALSLWRHINLGLAVLPAAFVLAQVAHIPSKILYAGYPTQLTILVLGVMLLWNHVQTSGLADRIVKNVVKLARGRVYLLPWVMFGLMGMISGIGALPAAAFAIVIPVALEIAKREKIRPSLMGIICIQGGCVGGFSPLNPWAALVSTMAKNANIHFHSGQFFLFNAALGIAISLIAFFVFGGIKLFNRSASDGSAAEEPIHGSNKNPSISVYQLASATSVIIFIVMVLMNFDIGLTGFALGFALMVAFPDSAKTLIHKLPWAILIMIAGVLLYVNLLDFLGVLKAIGDLLGRMDSPALVRVGLAFLGTIIANFESSSVAVLGLVIPIAIKSISSDLSPTGATFQLAMLAGSIVVMCSSPFHIGGALVLAETGNHERTYKDLLIWVLCLTAFLPLLALMVL
ncbi:MAG: Dicarboxylate carrier protein [Herbaspirillum sp.]|jgi:di/tricarboxylate transporter|nr:Dicarboxylate carrier protein [Herbaspirillum sp.]